MVYSTKIMTKVPWAFYGGEYDSLDKFIDEVNDFHAGCGAKPWDADEVVLPTNEVTIQFSYWDEAEDERVVDVVSLMADDEQFTASELLFKIHNGVVEQLEDEDDHYFDGLTLWEGENEENPNAPMYVLKLKGV